MKFPTISKTNTHSFSSDDVFSSLSDVWNSKTLTNEVKPSIYSQNINNNYIEEDSNKKSSSSNDYLNNNNDKSYLTEEKNRNTHKNINKDLENNQLISNMKSEPYWDRLKVILGNLKSILRDMNGDNIVGMNEVFDTIDKVINFGDKINVVGLVKNSFDPELLEFLEIRWNNTKNDFISSYPLVNSLVANTNSAFPKMILVELIRKVAGFLKNQAFLHLHEADFVINIMKSSGFKLDEIKEVFYLLDLSPPELKEDNVMFEDEGRSYSSNSRYSDYDISRTGGYGHSGGHGGYMMAQMDPFVLLAGLAFATFAAYLIYRLV